MYKRQSYGLVELVDFGIKSPFGYVGSDNAAGVIRDAAPEVYQASVYLGIVFAIIGIIRVCLLYTSIYYIRTIHIVLLNFHGGMVRECILISLQIPHEGKTAKG